MGFLNTGLAQSHFVSCPAGPPEGVMDPSRESQCGESTDIQKPGQPWPGRGQDIGKPVGPASKEVMKALLRGEAALQLDWPERAKPYYDNTAANPSCPLSVSFPSTVRARRGLPTWLQWENSRGFQGGTEKRTSFTHSPPPHILSGTQED